MTVLEFGLNAYVPFELDFRDGECEFEDRFARKYLVHIRWFNALYYSVVPCTIKLLGNCLVVRTLRKSERRFEFQVPCGKRERRKMKAQEWLLAEVTLALVLLCFPTSLVRIPVSLNPTLSADPRYYFARQFALLFSLVVHEQGGQRLP
ncbi:hypothetical protein BaRGS_00021058, partial [Batillaria attramentaria]